MKRMAGKSRCGRKIKYSGCNKKESYTADEERL